MTGNVAIEGPDEGFRQRLAGALAERGIAVAPLAEASAAVVLADRGDGVPDLAAAETSFAAFKGAALEHVVLVSSAAVLAPHHHNAGHLDETRVPPDRGENSLATIWRELERRAGDAFAATPLTVLRPVPVADPLATGGLAAWLRRRLVPTFAGHDPVVQLLSFEDFVAALAAALAARRPGTYHLAPAGVVPVAAAARLVGARRLPLPAWVHRLTRRRGLPRQAGRPGFDQLQALRHPATIHGGRAAAELGFVPQATSAQALLALRRTEGPAEPDPGRSFDPFGQDPEAIRAYGRTLFRFLHDAYWRIDAQGLDNVPLQGRAVLAGVHRGFMPFDGVMALHLLQRERGRMPRFLVHPTLLKFPFLSDFMTKLGGIVACQENADWVLGQEEIVGIYPEGIRGAFTPYRDAYKLGRFGRDEFVKIALRNRAPIVPFATVGSAEIFPIVGGLRWRWFQRFTEWPYLPLTLSLPGVPNPTKWHTRFLPPLQVQRRYGPEAADDPVVVRAISLEVRKQLEGAIADMVARRRSLFWGSLAEGRGGQEGRMGKEDRMGNLAKESSR